MSDFWNILIAVATFGIILVSSNKIAGFIKYIKLPLITGLLLMGIITGPEVLNIIKQDSLPKLDFVNHIALSFIAFAAGSELYFVELRSRMKSIRWMTFGQMITTLILGSLAVFIISGFSFFGLELDFNGRIALSIITGTIFIARSPVSAIAIINELRAKGPFTRMVLGVTVLIDFLVIVLFAISFSIAISLTTGESFSVGMIAIMLTELTASLLMGYILFLIIRLILYTRINTSIKAVLILAVGWGIYLLSNEIRHFSETGPGIYFYIEPLLVCITASLLITNYSPVRREFQKIIHDTVPMIYVAFFILIGASLSLKTVGQTWIIALILFFVRIVTMVIGGWIGGTLGGDPQKFNRTAWMSFVTQAGIGLGLVTVVTNEYPEWGLQFASIIVSVIVLNQIFGPPLFKWAIQMVNEDHPRGEHEDHKGPLKALIFGYEQQSLGLAQQLSSHDWKVTIVTFRKEFPKPENENITIFSYSELNIQLLERLDAANTDAIVVMKTDEENLEICELAYENYGTPELIVRLNERINIQKFHEMGVLIVEPTTAIISLMDHFVRSPMATSLLLGMEEHKDTADIVIRNQDIHGVAIRNLHLPADILIIATQRKGQKIISTGYTRLRLKDILTVVGSIESIEEMRLRFE
ncbi:MAG: cation:proton antiporter [Bacteroidota bacterium]|nr:cation:proton antiporter [Bacteroidota bacterium]